MTSEEIDQVTAEGYTQRATLRPAALDRCKTCKHYRMMHGPRGDGPCQTCMPEPCKCKGMENP